MRKISRGALLCALAVLSTLLPQVVMAQEAGDGPLLWISYVTAEPGKSNELGMRMAAEGAKIYDGLMEDGHVMSWGVAQAVNHYPGDDWTHLEFINFRDWAAVNEFIGRFMAGMQAMSEEERMADAAKWEELTVHGSHYDLIGRHEHLASAGGRPSYISLSTFNTKPGTDNDAVAEMYRKWRAPIMDELMEAGKLNAHGFYSRVMHGPEGWEDVTSWFTMSDLEAAEAADAARSEEEGAAMMSDMQQKFEFPGRGNHTDRLLVVLHYNAAEMAAAE